MQELQLCPQLVKQFGLLEQDIAVHFPQATTIFFTKLQQLPFSPYYFNTVINQQLLKFKDTVLTAGGWVAQWGGWELRGRGWWSQEGHAPTGSTPLHPPTLQAS